MENRKLKSIYKESLLKALFFLFIGARRHCFVEGESMMPFLKDGDLIIYKPYNKKQDKLYQGSLVVVKHPLDRDALIVKRISKISFSYIEILGDNKFHSIDSRHFGAIKKDLIHGIVKVLVPN